MDIVYNLLMDSNKNTDYRGMVKTEHAKLKRLLDQRDELDLEIAKSRQLIFAAANMLSDREREMVWNKMALTVAVKVMAEMGLTEAIKNVLQKYTGEWLTVTRTRDRLRDSGFDFSSYKSSPLASISTILKRLPPEDVERSEIDGVRAYRWIGKIESAPVKTSGLSNIFGLATPIVEAKDLGKAR
jgi:hypothetical protein